jgi:hypothetical protein
VRTSNPTKVCDVTSFSDPECKISKNHFVFVSCDVLNEIHTTFDWKLERKISPGRKKGIDDRIILNWILQGEGVNWIHLA